MEICCIYLDYLVVYLDGGDLYYIYLDYLVVYLDGGDLDYLSELTGLWR